MMKIFESAWNMVKGIWDTLMQLFQGKINIFEAIFQIGAQILGHVAEVFKIVWDVAGSILGGVADIFKSVFNTAKVYLEGVANIFGSVFEGAKNVFNGIIDAFKGLFEKLGQIHVAIISGLREGLSGLGGFLADMFNQMNPIALFEKIFKVDTGAFGKKGPVEEQLGIDIPFMKFAKGGMVPGMGSVPNDSKLNDRIVALLSAGEAIIPKSKMDDPAVASIVQGILSGKIGAPGYALGGSVVKSMKNLGGDLAESFQGAVAPIADVLNPAQILDNLWKQMKGLVWDKVADMFWSMLSANKFHDGGMVPGSGEMPSMLKGGEFVLNKSAASSIGVPTLNDLNAGRAPSNNTQNIELNLVINTTQPIDATIIKNKIMPVIREELKRASIDGRTTIYQSGVRTA
jgi:hypothetical protein